VTLDPSIRNVVSPNADTPYSCAMLNLTAEPLVLHVPAVEGRYWVMQWVDFYGYNAHYLGTRTTGTKPGTYLLAGPDWDGDTPEGIDEVMQFETNIVNGFARTQLLNPDDLPALSAIMNEFDLEPLSSYLGEPVEADPYPWPMWDEEASLDERFVGLTNELFTFCKPNPADAEVLERMTSIGVGPGATLDLDTLPADQRQAIAAGVQNALAKMSERARTLSETVNGWQALSGFGDRDYFKGDLLLKAAAATVGYGANDPIEAYYPVCRVDADGNALEGGRRYRLTFSEPPPNNAFWSVTLYDTSYDGTGGFMIENPIDRYLINSNIEGLVYGDDGSLTIAVEHGEPENAADRANWLPAPESGGFYLMLRIYMPKPSILDGTWKPPAVEKIA